MHIPFSPLEVSTYQTSEEFAESDLIISLLQLQDIYGNIVMNASYQKMYCPDRSGHKTEKGNVRDIPHTHINVIICSCV